jgi:FtsX-like permease family
MLSLFLRMAWKNVLLYRRKSLLAVAAVATCYFALNVFEGYIQGAESIFEDSYSRRSMLGDLIIRREGLTQAISVEEESLIPKAQQTVVEELLHKDPAVALLARTLRVTGTYNNGESQAVFTGAGYDVKEGEIMRQPTWGWNALAGHPLRPGVDEVLVGTGLGGLLGCHSASHERFITGQGGYEPKERPFDCPTRKLQVMGVTMHGQANSVDVEISGLMDAMFREVDMRFSYLPLTVVQRLLDTDSISYFTVSLQPGSDVDGFVARMNESLKSKGLELRAAAWKDDPLGEFYRKTMTFLHVFRNFMVLVILGVALFSIFNTFMRNVQDRTREIGVLRTLGFRVEEIRLLFLLETLILALLGTSLGGFTAILVGLVVNRAGILYKIGLLTQPVPFLIHFSAPVLLLTVVLVVGVTLGAVAVPVLRSEKRKITDSLNYV